MVLTEATGAASGAEAVAAGRADLAPEPAPGAWPGFDGTGCAVSSACFCTDFLMSSTSSMPAARHCLFKVFVCAACVLNC